jgi:hypothetical protein
MKDKLKKFVKEYGLPISMFLAFSVIFRDIAMGVIFGFVFYVAQDKKDCCK